MWRNMIRIWPAPDSRAAITKSSVRKDRYLPRTTLAIPVHEMSERIMVMEK